jgi:PAS domain S-box-containing protein
MSRPRLAAVVGLVVGAVVTVPFVVLTDRIERVVLAALIALLAALAAGLWAKRSRSVNEQRLVERRGILKQAEDAEHNYRALLESLPLVTWLYEVGDRSATRYVSPQVEAILGYSPAEWSEPGLFLKSLHPDDRERVVARIEEAAGNEVPHENEYRLIGRGGRVAWVRELATTVRNAVGEPLYGRSFVIDIGDRKRIDEERDRLLAAERAAVGSTLERQRRLDLVREVAEVASWSLDSRDTIQRIAELVVQDLADWCVVDISDDGGSLQRLAVARAEPPGDAGGAPDEQPEQAVRAVFESGKPRVIPPLGESSNREGAESFLGRVEAQSVVCVPLSVRNQRLGAITVARTSRGHRYGADDLALVEDLAGRIAIAFDRARLYLEVEQRADAARVLAHVADGTLLLDRSGIVRLWNPAAERITAIRAADIVGRAAVEAIPGWREIADQVPASTSVDPAQSEVVVPIETEDGERWLAISAVQFFGGMVYAFRDVTEVRHLEELKADFIATASHELRTPLAAVYGAAQTLLRHDFALDEGGRDRFVSMIAEESERLGRIVNEILLANQLEAGRLDLEFEPFDAVELVERVVEATRTHAPQGISLEVNAPDHVPLVSADRDKVRQVLINLVENAIKYSPDGGSVAVGVDVRGEYARFSVRDEGLGIPPEERPRIFEKFYRVDPQMTRSAGGTGLGLYICNELVSRMGGRIWVEANDDKGSSFLFELPTGDASGQRLSAEPAERRAQGSLARTQSR